MKTTNKLFLITLLVFSFISLPIMAQTSQPVWNAAHTSGTLTLSAADCQEEDWTWSTVIMLPTNVPIKITYKIDEAAFVDISTSDITLFSYYGPTALVTNIIKTTDGYFNMYAEDGGNGIPSGSVFTITFTVLDTYDVNKDFFVSGNAGIGTYPVTKLHVMNADLLSPTAGNYVPLTRVEGNTGNKIMVNDFFFRESTRADWFSASYVQGISIDGSFMTPETLRPWMKFKPGDEKIEFGSFQKNYMSIGSKVGIGTLTPNTKLESVSGVNAYAATTGTTQTGAALRLRGGDNAILDFGMNSINTWIQATDQTNLAQKYNICLNPNGGNIGIGTGSTEPDYKLTVNGNFKVKNGANYLFYDGAADFVMKCEARGVGGRAIVHDGGNLLTINYGNDFTGGTRIGTNVFFKDGGVSYINTGRVAIGLPDAATKLAASPIDEIFTVNGAIHAKEVRVDLTGSLADYVFDSGYKLMPLHQVEQYVKTNNHLPEIPSAAEVQKNGMSMGEMQNKLLQKVEELTLYVIEQQKRIEQLEKNQK